MSSNNTDITKATDLVRGWSTLARQGRYLHSRDAADMNARPEAGYKRLAQAWGVEVADLYTPEVAALFAKAEELTEYAKPEPVEKPATLTVEDVLNGDAADWQKKIKPTTKAKAPARIPNAGSLAADIRRRAVSSLTGQAAFNHIVSVLDVAGAVEDLRQANAERKPQTFMTPEDVKRATADKWNSAYLRLLWLDAAVPAHLRPVLWARIPEVPEMIVEKADVPGAQSVVLYGNAEKTMNAKVALYRDAWSLRADHGPISGSAASLSDHCLRWLADDRIPGVSLSVAESWEELERRAQSFKRAGNVRRVVPTA